MEENRNIGPLIIIMLTVAVALGAYLIKTGNNPFLFFRGEKIEPVVREVVPGALAEGFPVELILTSDAKVERSVVTELVEQKRTILTASYSTQSSLSDIYAAYLSYFVDNNFEVFRSDSKPGSSSIAAKGPKYSVGVTITYLYQDTHRVRIDVNKNNEQTP